MIFYNMWRVYVLNDKSVSVNSCIFKDAALPLFMHNDTVLST
ncbi:hypothetical protein PPECC79_49420 [Escherichia coli PCN079]|uniref:Uncharacterized protein n=1 Tax=Escherichia coli TaxID=562 RepID=A0A173GM35_ECOLX|nr:hypothetical protein PPECC33_p3132 [Escherichia coli PCN033]ANH56045.1 hypothetical protein [Escherichia coli]EZK28965.1 hypothetical protein AB12_3055 [Escherichia coli 1-182-04_S1_C1]OAF89053.1 hypothetical protein PPECC79_49420 [Escherichia coli PCN079]AVX49434.1 hypothetical protein [Escherichia coli]